LNKYVTWAENIHVGLCTKVKSFPSHMGLWGGADLRFL